MTYFGGGGGVSPGGNTDFTGNVSVLDAAKFKIKNQADPTKIIQFSAASVGAGQTRTITVPNSNTTLPIAAQVITFAGPTTSRTYTFGDADYVVAAVNIGQTFTGANSFTNQTSFSGGVAIAIDTGIQFGSTVVGDIAGLSGQTPDTLAILAGSGSNHVIMIEVGDVTFDFAHPAQTNPTFFVHSANQSTTQWTGLTHNGTDGVISTGAGALSIQSASGVKLVRTVTAGGTTGNQTIDKMAGTVNFAAGASSITVTNNQTTTSSIIFGVIRTADATATFIKSIVPGTGSFVITLNAVATAETSVGFMVTN